MSIHHNLRSHRRYHGRRARILCSAAGFAAALLPGAASLRASQLTDTWTGGTGNWSTASDWSLGVVPNNATNTYLVVIDGNNAVNSAVTQDVNASIDGLTIDAGDSLAMNNASSLQIAPAGGSIVDNGTLSLNSTGNLTDLHFNGDLSLSGSGSINLSNSANNRIYSNNSGRLTLAAGLTLVGAGQLGAGQTAISSAATITASGSGGLLIRPSALGFANTGTLQASGGPLILQSANFTNSGSGAIIAQTGSEVRLDNATITGGTLSSVGTGFVHDINSVHLDGVTFTGSYVQDNSTSTTLLSGVTNNGQINLNSTGNLTDLVIAADVAISGTGKIQLSGNPNNRIYASGNQHLTLGANQTIQGSGQIGVGLTTVTNNGQILADGAGGMTLSPGGGGFANAGGIQAINGAPLTLQGGQFANTGTIQMMDTSQLRLSNTTVTGGTIAASGSATLHTVNGGTLAQLTASGPMSIDAGTLAVNNVTYTGNITVSNSNLFQLAGPFTQTGDLAMNGTGNLTDLAIVGSQTYGGTGTITLSNNANNRIYSTNNGTLTIPATRTIRGAGQIGVAQTGIVSAALIDGNQTAGLVIHPNGAGVTNTGTLQASGGGLMVLQAATVTNTGGLIQALAGSEMRLDGSTLLAGNLTAIGTGMIHDISNATLDNVTLTGTYNQDNSATTTLRTSLTNNGIINLHSSGNLTDLAASTDVAIGGTGSILLSDNANNRIYSTNNGHITFNQNVSGSGQIGVAQTGVVNNALIDSNATQGITIRPNAGGVANAGTLQASNGGTLLLQNGTFTNSGPGVIQALAGSQIRLDSAIIVGGPLTAVPTASITDVNNATLDNVTLSGTYNQGNSIATHLLHTLTNNGTINLGSTGNLTDLSTQNDVTIDGTGSIVLSDSPNNRIYSANSAHLTIGANQTIRGSGQIGVAQTGLINNGLIDATGIAGIVVNPGALGLTNAGTLQADTGSFLKLQNGTFTNAPGATIQALGNSEVRLDQATIVNGTISGAAHTLSTATFQNAIVSGSLITDANTHTIFAHNATGLTSTLTSLTLGANATVNLANNSLRINYGTGPSPAAAIRTALVSGYNHGAWNGLGIDSSDGNSTDALGYADTADGGIAGLPASSNAVLIKYTLVGDLNLDGIVNFTDLLRLAQNYGATNAQWDQGDLNYDGTVGFPDLLALAQNYGKALPAAAVSGDAPPAFSAVPEPAAVALLSVAAFITCGRRRRPGQVLIS